MLLLLSEIVKVFDDHRGQTVASPPRDACMRTRRSACMYACMHDRNSGRN